MRQYDGTTPSATKDLIFGSFLSRVMACMSSNRLYTVLLVGAFLCLLSGVGGYYWARPPAETPSSQRTETTAAAETPSPDSPDSSSDTQLDTATLSPDDWELFTRYEGERERMLGVKKQYEAVNLRGGPGNNFPSITTVRGGSLLFVLDRMNQWFRARTENGTVGWIHRPLVRQLRIPQPVVERIRDELPSMRWSIKSQIPDSFRSHNRLEVREARVNLRQGPGRQFGLVGHAYRHQELRLLAREGDWYRIETVHGRTAWVMHTLVRPLWITEPSERRKIRFRNAGLRNGPHFQFQEPDPVSPDQPVPVLEEREGWLLVRLDQDRIGWLHESEVTQGNPPRTDEPAGQDRQPD